MSSKIPPLRHSLPPKPQVAPTTQSDELVRLNKSLIEEARRRQSLEMEHTSSMAFELQANLSTLPDLLLSPTSASPGLTTGSTSLASLHSDISPIKSSHNGQSLQRSYFDAPKSYLSERSIMAAPYAQQMSYCSTKTMSKTHMHHSGSFDQLAYPYDQNKGHAQPHGSPAFFDSRGTGAAPLLIPMQPSGDGLPLTSVIESLSSKGSRAAAENPETVAHAWKLRQWGIGIGPGVNPKVSTNRIGSQGRPRAATDDPPIVNTGNSGPMCVQPGDWICTACGFVNWRRRKVCMRCYPFAEGNEVCQGIHSGEMLAKKLAGGLDPTSDEFQQSLQALSLDRPKRTTEANPHHFHQGYERDQPGIKGAFARSDTGNSLGIHINGQDFSPYSSCVPQTYAVSNHFQAYCPESKLLSSALGSSLVATDTFQAMHTLRGNAQDLHKSIWAPAPKRPVPIPMDPEERDSGRRRAKLEPIGTKTSSNYTSSNSGKDAGHFASDKVAKSDFTTTNGRGDVLNQSAISIGN